MTCAPLCDLEVGSYPLVRSSPPAWHGDSRRLVALLAHRGLTSATVLAVPSGEVLERIGGERQVTVLHAVDATVAFSAESMDQACAVETAGWDGADSSVQAGPNRWHFSRRHARPERREFTMDDGARVDGWVLRPSGRQRGPLLIDVHGGPASYVELGFGYHPYWHVLCERGWTVLAINAIGSGSYGRGWSEPLRGHWGELDLPQHLQAAGQLQREGLVDSRWAIAGKSYGGFLSAWALGHTGKLCAAIVSAPVSNLESHAGTSDSGDYVLPYDMQGELHERRALFRRLSPVFHAHQSVTPALILQGEDDERCPAGQSEELFSILLRNGRAPVEMVLYPGGGHDLAENGRPSHRLDYHRRVVDWCERWAAERARAPGAEDAAKVLEPA